MSWDVSLAINTGLANYRFLEVRNVTNNNSKILAHLGVHPNLIVDKKCAEIATIIMKALSEAY